MLRLSKKIPKDFYPIAPWSAHQKKGTIIAQVFRIMREENENEKN